MQLTVKVANKHFPTKKSEVKVWKKRSVECVAVSIGVVGEVALVAQWALPLDTGLVLQQLLGNIGN